MGGLRRFMGSPTVFSKAPKAARIKGVRKGLVSKVAARPAGLLVSSHGGITIARCAVTGSPVRGLNLPRGRCRVVGPPAIGRGSSQAARCLLPIGRGGRTARCGRLQAAVSLIAGRLRGRQNSVGRSIEGAEKALDGGVSRGRAVRCPLLVSGGQVRASREDGLLRRRRLFGETPVCETTRSKGRQPVVLLRGEGCRRLLPVRKTRLT